MVYALNVSLVHLTLLMMSLGFVKWPDVNKARKFDKEFGDTKSIKNPNMYEINCLQYAEGMHQWIIIIVCVHVACTFINLFREIYET